MIHATAKNPILENEKFFKIDHRLRVNEDQHLKDTSLVFFKKLITDDNLCIKMEDTFLIRFLRAKRFNLAASYTLLRNYLAFKSRHAESWLVLKRSTIRGVLSRGILNILDGRDVLNRRIFWLRAGEWTPDEYNADTLLMVGAMLAEVALMEATVQASGVVAIFDMGGFGLSQLRGIPPAFARKMVHYLAHCLPIRIHAIHVIRESATFALLFALFKNFVDEKMKNRIYFHGHDMDSLAQSVDREVLPLELGGYSDADPARWADLMAEPVMMKELNALGYKIIEDIN